MPIKPLKALVVTIAGDGWIHLSPPRAPIPSGIRRRTLTTYCGKEPGLPGAGLPTSYPSEVRCTACYAQVDEYGYPRPTELEDFVTPAEDAVEALRMIRRAIEAYGPKAAPIPRDDVVTVHGPEQRDEARALIEAIHRLAGKPQPVAPKGGSQSRDARR